MEKQPKLSSERNTTNFKPQMAVVIPLYHSTVDFVESPSRRLTRRLHSGQWKPNWHNLMKEENRKNPTTMKPFQSVVLRMGAKEWHRIPAPNKNGRIHDTFNIVDTSFPFKIS